mgnify:CR=1 FL=1
MQFNFLKVHFVCLLILLVSYNVLAQNDTGLVESLINSAEKARTSNSDSAIVLAQKAVNQASGLDDKFLLLKAEHTLGYCYYNRNDFELALTHLQKSLELAKEQNQELWVAINLNRIGNVYQLRSDFVQALNSYRNALDINERIKDKIQMAQIGRAQV